MTRWQKFKIWWRIIKEGLQIIKLGDDNTYAVREVGIFGCWIDRNMGMWSTDEGLDFCIVHSSEEAHDIIQRRKKKLNRSKRKIAYECYQSDK